MMMMMTDNARKIFEDKDNTTPQKTSGKVKLLY
jgi:hypothetical protein